MATIKELLSGKLDNTEEEEVEVASPEKTQSTGGSNIASLLAGNSIDSEPDTEVDTTEQDPAQADRAQERAMRQHEVEQDESIFSTIFRSIGGGGQFATEKGSGTIEEISPELEGSRQGAVASYEMAERAMEAGRIGKRRRMGTATKGDLHRLEEIKAEDAKVAKLAEENPRMLRAMSNLAPFLVNSAVKGGKGAMVGSMLGAGLAGIAGNLVPGFTLFPEEAFTIPVGAKVGATIGASFGAVSDISDIEGGMAYNEFLEMGMDEDKAKVASDAVGLGSGLLELAQFKMLKRLVPGADKVITGAFGRAVTKVMGQNSVAKATGGLVGTAVPEAGIEALQEFWGNVVEEVARDINSSGDLKDLSSEDWTEVKDNLKKGVFDTFVDTALGFGGLGLPTAAANVAIQSTNQALEGTSNVNVETSEPGVTVSVPDNSRQTPIRQEATATNSVESLLGVDGQDGSTPPGVSVSNEQGITDEQRSMHHQNIDAYKQVLNELAGDKAVEKYQGDINVAEERLQNLVGFYNDQVADESPEGALQVAQMMDQEVQSISQAYDGLITAGQQRAKNRKRALPEDEILKVQSHVKRLQEKSQERIKQQTSLVQINKQKAQQAQIDKMDTDQGLYNELLVAAVQSNRDGKPTEAKLFNSVIGEMKLKERMGQFEYFKNTPMKKINSMLVQLEVNREARKGDPNQDVFSLAREQHLERWLNEQVQGRIEYDQVQLAGERFTLEEGKAQKEAQLAKEAERAKPAVEAVRKQEQQTRAQQVEKEKSRVATKARTVEKGKRTVADLRKALAKPIPGPTRTVELEEAKTAKAKRMEEIKKLRRQNPDLDDSPAKKVVSQDIGKLKNEDIAKMSYKDRARAVLGEDASGEEVNQLAKQAEKVAKDLEKKSKIDDTILQDIDPESKAQAKSLFRAAAIRYDGNVFEGPNHMQILIDNGRLDKLLFDKSFDNNLLEDGFVQHDGTFRSRDEATKMVRKADGEELYSEDFVQQLRWDRSSEALGTKVYDLTPTKKRVLKLSQAARSEQELGKQKVLRAMNDNSTGFVTLAKKLVAKTGVGVAVVSDIPNMKQSQEFKDIFTLSRAVYSGAHKAIFMNVKALSTKTPEQIQRTFLHEALHATMDNVFRSVNEATYLRGMRQIGDWWSDVRGQVSEAALRKGDVLDPRVRTFIGVMDKAQIGFTNAQIALEEGKGTSRQLLLKSIRFEEGLTYPFVSPAVAKFLNGIQVAPAVKTSKIKTMWDWMVNQLLTAFGVPVRTGSSLAKLTDIANEVFNLQERGVVRASVKMEAQGSGRWRTPLKKFIEATKDNPNATVPQLMQKTGLSRYEVDNLRTLAKENRASITDDFSFNFGANVNKETVTQWEGEIAANAKNAIESVVAGDHTEMSEILGFEAHPGARAIWQNVDGKSRIVFNAEAFSSQDDFISAWMHEQVAHQGLRNVFGKNTALFNRFLDQAYTLFITTNAKQVFDIADLYDIGLDKEGNRKDLFSKAEKREIAEEIIALKAETLKPVVKKGLLKRFKAFLNSWLPKRFVDVKSTFKMSDEAIMDMLYAARENVLTGSNQFGQLLTSALEDRTARHKSQGWKNLPAFIESDETYLGWAEEVKKVAPNLQKWYSEHVETIKQAFGKDTDLFNVLLAITSPQADVETNVQFAVDTYAYMMGLRDRPGALFPNVLKKRIDTHWTNPSSMLANLESKNFKVTEFTRALLGDPDATVGDLWMFRAFYGDPAVNNKEVENYSVPQIVGLRQKLHDLAAQMSEKTGETWTPREMQAAIWVYINSKQTGKDITKVASYQSGLNRPSPKYGDKSPLEWLKKLVPNLSDGPLSDTLGISTIDLAPTSALAKKRLLQLSKEGDLKLKPVKTVTDAQRFINAQKENKYAPVLTILEAKELAESIKSGQRKVFITEDGQAGFAVQEDGDIQMVFSNSDKKGVGVNLMAEAITQGGRKLDAYDPFLPEWYSKTFGFEETGRDTFDPQYAKPGWESDPILSKRPDVVYMALREDALGLYSDKKGKVKPNLVRDNLGGFSGNYTREVRYSRQAMDALNTMADLDSAENDRMFLATREEQESHVGKIHQWRDQAAMNIDRFAAQLEQEFLDKFGGRKSRVKVVGTGRLLHTAESELMAKAMNLYIDSGQGTKRDKAVAFARKLAVKGKNRTAGETEKLKIVEAMLSLSAGAQAWANQNIRPKYDEFFAFAKKHDILDSYIEDYVKRVWRMPDRFKDAGITWDGGGTTGFKLTPSSGKQRTLSSIIDGWEAGLELNTTNVMANLQAYGNEIGYVFANRRFVDYMRSLVGPSGESSVMLVRDKAQNPPEGFVKLTTRGFAAPGKVVYARADLGKMINKIGETASDFWDKPLLQFTRRINSMLKSTILSVTMFHHLAGLRSYVFGVRGTGLDRLRPFKAYRDGLKLIDEKTGFKDPNYQHLGPMVDLLVGQGLTLGRQQDWEEGSVMDSTIEEYLRKVKTPGAEMALHGWQGARRWKRQWTNGLFGQLFGGLKAQSAAVELTREITKQEKKLGRGLTEEEVNKEAEKVARLINADFGGLHLKRMGRNPDMQRWAQLLMLAPDWTESNWRTVTGMVPGVNKAINKVIGDNPAPKGMGSVYRKFWIGIAWKGALSVMAAQWAVLALFGDEDDKKEYMKQLSEASTREGFAKGRWASVDITPVLRSFGVEPPEGKRSDLNVLGHFKDIFKAGTPVTLAKHKVSPAVRLAESMVTRTDWKGDRFRTVTEMIDHGSFALVADKYKDPREPEGWDAGLQQLFAASIYNIRQSFPIPLSEVAQAWQGESSWMSSIGRGLGVDVRDVRHKDPNEKFYWNKSQEIKRLERNLDEARQVRDQKMIYEARKDIRDYDNFNRTKARLGFARSRLNPINKKIRALEAKLDKGQLSETEMVKLRMLKKRKAEIYRKFSEVIGR